MAELKQKNDFYFNLTNIFFILAILIFSITSLFHVTVFWLISNSLFLSIIMSVATGVGIISSLLSTKYTNLTYISFTLIILIELFGNIYGSFIHIDVNSEYFKGWKELMEPIFMMFYATEDGIPISDAIYKRWAAIIQGSFIPLLLSITFHMWMVVKDKYEKMKPQLISVKPSKFKTQKKTVESFEKNISEETLIDDIKETDSSVKETDSSVKEENVPEEKIVVKETFAPVEEKKLPPKVTETKKTQTFDSEIGKITLKPNDK
jgi:hypothetical protein